MNITQSILTILILSAFISCSFPTKGFIKHANKVAISLPELSVLIRHEYPINASSQSPYNIQNTDLANKLKRLGVDEISIEYSSRLSPELDSTITFANVKGTDDEITYKKIICFFSNSKPKHVPEVLKNSETKFLNDSTLLQKDVLYLVIVY